MEQIEMVLASDVPGVGVQGQRVTLALQPSDVHDPTEIPTYLGGYKPFGYRADEVSKVILVDKDEDKYRNFSSDDAFRLVNVKTSNQAYVPEVDPKSALTNYKVVERAVGAFVPAVTQQQVSNPGLDPLMVAARRCKNALMADRELDVMTLLGTNTSWSSIVRTAIGAGNEWDDQVNGHPLIDLQTAIELAWQTVTEIWVTQKTAHTLLRHVEIRDHMRQMLGDGAAPSALQQVARATEQNVDFQIPGLPPIRVVASKYKNETTGLLTPFLSDDVAVLAHTVPGVPTDGEEISASYTFRRRGPSGTGFEAREFFVPNRGANGGTMVVVSMADIAVMTSNVAGGIVTNTQP